MFGQLIRKMESVHMDYARIAEMQQKIARHRCKTDNSIAKVNYRLEKAVFDLNSRVEALASHLGLVIEEAPPEKNKYRARKKGESR